MLFLIFLQSFLLFRVFAGEVLTGLFRQQWMGQCDKLGRVDKKFVSFLQR